MKLSVVTIVYNDAEHIEKTLKSVINQTLFKDIEYIVVDGASTDGTSDIIKRYSNYITKYICEPDTGIYNAMNKGLAAASGDYIQFMNSGDVFSATNTVEKIFSELDEKKPDVAYGHYREVDSNKSTSAVIPCRNADKIWYGMVAAHLSTLYRIAHLQKHNIIYDESYKIAADYKFTAEAIKLANVTLKTDICISDFDVSGVSSTNANKGLGEANRVRKEVFGWTKSKIFALTVILLGARYTKRFAYPLYKLLRHRQ